MAADGEVSSNQLRIFIEQLERLEEEKLSIMETINDVFVQAKSMGFDPKIMKEIMEIYKLKKNASFGQEELFELYNNVIKWLSKKEGPRYNP